MDTQQVPIPVPMPAAIYAGFWLRAIAILIDVILLNIVLLLVKVNSYLTITVIVSWLYFSLMESSPWQATIGKKILGIKVTDLVGRRISFLRATGRYFAKIISAVIVFIGYIMAAFTEKKQALHDIIAGTLVIRN
jgi:uncharacterized RDD family membrane protein YckC